MSEAIRGLVPDAVPHGNGHGPAPSRAPESAPAIDLMEAKRESRPMTLLTQPLHDRHVWQKKSDSSTKLATLMYF